MNINLIQFLHFPPSATYSVFFHAFKIAFEFCHINVKEAQKKGKQKQKSSDFGESLKAKKPATSPIYKQITIEAVRDLTIMKIDVRKSMGAIMFLVTLGKC